MKGSQPHLTNDMLSTRAFDSVMQQNETTRVEQVEDDPELLNLLMADVQQAPEVFKPTNYWKYYEKIFLPELRRSGLKDFRRRRQSVLSSFGATDLMPQLAKIDVNRSSLFQNEITKRLPGWKRLGYYLNCILNAPGKAPLLTDIYDCSGDDLRYTAYKVAQLYGESAGARPLQELSVSLAGNPEDVIQINGNHYTMRSLYYYMRYAYCCRFIDFEKVKTIVELGPGSGKQVEVIRKLHPHVHYLLFDIPPQLYVCEQFLKSSFNGSVISYRTTREKGFTGLHPGKIYLAGTWQFPLLERVPVDLFWNAVSFQEMEPDIVANYLDLVNRNAKAVFLQQMMMGKQLAREAGSLGVLKRTTLEHYRDGLSEFNLLDVSTCLRPLGILRDHQDSFWRRREDAAVTGVLSI